MSKFAFIPTKEEKENSNIFQLMKKYDISDLSELNAKAKKNLDWFWSICEKDLGIVWDTKYESVYDFSKGYQWPRWFVGGKTNIYSSSIEKHAKELPNKTAYYFLSENDDYDKLSYKELEISVNKLANGLLSLGLRKGDVVAIYLPMIKESIISIMACAKLGLVQTVIFSGFSSDSLKIRLQDCKAKILIISDGYFRKGKEISQKKIIDDSITGTEVKKIIVIPYKGIDDFTDSKFSINYNDLVITQSETCKTEVMDSEDPLFILYTSGTTGNPKGVVHTHGGFSVFAGHQAKYLIDMKKDDILFWPADIGWITGLVWNVYGLLQIGSCGIIYDGSIDWPNPKKIWKILDDFNVTIFGLSPTAIRMFRKSGLEPRMFYNLDSIRIMPTTGEPIDEESWWWLFEKVGNKKIPIMNLSGGTEIGGAMLSVFPGMKLKPTTVGIPCPGIDVDVIDDQMKSVVNKKGYLIIRTPWPTMTRGLLNDSQRYFDTYWSRFKNIWFHGDYVQVDEDGLWYMLGRVDDVINVAGHRLSTAEIEQKVMSLEIVSEAASVSVPDEITGDAIILFVVLKNDLGTDYFEQRISQFVSDKIGKIAKPKKIIKISELPKTKTGKIMRRLMKSKLLGLELGDLSSLDNPNVLEEIPIYKK